MVLAAQVSDSDPGTVENQVGTLVEKYLAVVPLPVAVAGAAVAPEAIYLAKLRTLMQVTARGLFTLRAEYLAIIKGTEDSIATRTAMIQKLENLGPLTGDSLWPKVLSLAGGAGLTGAVQAAVVKGANTALDPKSAPTFFLWGLGGALAGLIGLQVLAWALTSREVSKLQTSVAADEQATWKSIVKSKLEQCAWDFLREASELAAPLNGGKPLPYDERMVERAISLANPGIFHSVSVHQDGRNAPMQMTMTPRLTVKPK
jgi:hypothetical protein